MNSLGRYRAVSRGNSRAITAHSPPDIRARSWSSPPGYVCMYVCVYVCSNMSSMLFFTHVQQASTLHHVTTQPRLNNAHQKSTMSSKEIYPRQSSSRRDSNCQRRKAETPEERRRKLDRLKEYTKWKRELGTQEDADIRHSKNRQQQRQWHGTSWK